MLQNKAENDNLVWEEVLNLVQTRVLKNMTEMSIMVVETELQETSFIKMVRAFVKVWAVVRNKTNKECLGAAVE